MNQTHGQRTTWEHIQALLSLFSSSGVLTPIFNWQRFRASKRETKRESGHYVLGLGDNRQAVLVAGNGEMKSPFSHSHAHTRMPYREREKRASWGVGVCV